MFRYAPLIFGLLALHTPLKAQTLVESGQDLPGVWAGAAAWADYDLDGDQDLALMGETGEDGQCLRIVRIYDNLGSLLAEAQTPGQALIGAYHGDLAWADYDSDGDPDLAVVGWDEDNEESLRLYINGENGAERTFAQDLLQIDDAGQSVLKGVRYAALDWGDYDSDGDLDLIVSGMDPMGTSLTVLYENDGGVLEIDEINSEGIVNVHHGNVAWADYDSDGDLDLAVSGENATVTAGEIAPVTEFYLNDPSGTLSLNEPTSVLSGVQFDEYFSKIRGGDLAWGDYDQDGSVDLAIAGRNYYWDTVLRLYRNRPSGVLTNDETFNITSTRRVASSLAWIDYDNDGDLDLAATGRSILSEYQAFVFTSEDGRVGGAPAESLLEGLAGGSATWVDFDEDGRADLLLTGSDASGQRRSILYNNQSTVLPNSAPTPPQVLNQPKVTSSQIFFSWSSGEDTESTELTYNLRVGSEPESGDIFGGPSTIGPGNVGFKNQQILRRSMAPDKYYWSVQAVDGGLARSAWSQEQEFRIDEFVSSNQRIRSLDQAAMDWGDYDQDGDFDLVITGLNRAGEAQSSLYVNRDGNLVVESGSNLEPLRNGDVDWGDYDNDGDLDLLLTGEDTNENRSATLYETDGERLVLSARFLPSVSKSAADWGDYDHDGDLDLAIMGQSETEGSLQPYTLVFANDGLGSFEVIENEFIGLYNGEVLWGDYDQDGDLDLAAAGFNAEDTPEFRIYENEGAQFADAGLDLPGLGFSDLAWGDYDGDGDFDLAAGGTSDGGVRTDLYVNDGEGGLVPLADGNFPGIQAGDLVWGDYDNDRDLDLVIIGRGEGDQAILQVYENALNRASSESAFVEEEIDLLKQQGGLQFSAVALVDIDSDGDLDLISAGSTAGTSPIVKTIVNENLTAKFNRNLPPETPLVQGTVDEGNAIIFNWQEAFDDGEDTPLSLSYNLRVGTSEEGHEVLSGNVAHGSGNIGQKLQHQLLDLESGTYFWSVQAVDDGFARSEWSNSQSFIIDTVAPEVKFESLGPTRLGINQTATLALSFFDLHSGLVVETAPTVQVVVGDEVFDFEPVQFTGDSWSGRLTVAAEMPSGSAAIRVSGALDQKGNVMTVFDTVDVLVLDTTLPTVTEAFPEIGASEVGVETEEITIRFSESIDPASISNDHFKIRRGSTVLVHSGEKPDYDETTNTVSIEPVAGLSPGSEYTVEVSAAIQDLAGNRPDDAISWSFSTRVPQIAQLTPVAGDSTVATADNVIEALFDHPIDTEALGGNVTVFKSGAEVEIDDSSIELLDDGLRARFSLASGLEAGSAYQVRVAAAVGGPLREGDYVWEFSTAVPELVDTNPVANAEAVEVGLEEVQLTFSAPIDTIQLTPTHFVLSRGGQSVELRSGDPIDRGGNIYALAPDGGFAVGTRYDLQIAPAVSGPLGSGEAETVSFSTRVPALTATTPADGDTALADLSGVIEASFDAPIDQAVLVADGNVALLESGEAIAISTPSYNADVVSFFPVDGFKPGARYTVIIDGLVEGPLHAAASGDFSWHFQTPVPELVSQSPLGAVEEVGDRIKAEFSAAIDESLLTPDKIAQTVQVTREGEEEVLADGGVDFDPATRELSIELAEGFKPGALYAVVLDGLLAGPLRAVGEGDFSWHFQTPVPQLVDSTPDHQLSDVATADNVIEALFDHPIDEETMRIEGNVAVFKGGAKVEIDDNDIELLDDDRTARFSLASGLEAGFAYQIRIAAAVGGPRREGDYVWEFSTAVPELVDTNPVANAEAVEVGLEEVQLTFSAPIDTIQLTPTHFVLSRGGQSVELRSGDPIDRGGNIYALAPDGGFAVGTRYDLQIAPAVSGPLGSGEAETVSFSTRVPVLIATTPADGDAALADLSGLIEASFDAPIDQAVLVADGNVALLESGEAIAISTPSYDQESGVVRFAPVAGFKPGARYTVVIDGLVAGPLHAAASGDFSWHFQTPVPELVSQSPLGAVEEVGDRIKAEFSAAIDESLLAPDKIAQTIEVTREGEGEVLADGGVDFDPATRELSIELADGFKPGALYAVVLDGLLAGPLRAVGEGDFSWQFQTPVPQLVDSTPDHQLSDVATADNVIEALFDHPIDSGVLFTEGNVTVFKGGVEVETDGLEYLNPNRTARFSLASGLEAGSAYQVRIAAAVGGPRREGDYVWEFSTAVPELIAANPADQTEAVDVGLEEVRLIFSAPIDEAKLRPNPFLLSREGRPVELRSGDPVPRGDNTYGLAPASGFQVGTRYQLQISPVVSGPLGSGKTEKLGFSTAVPVLVGRTPADGDTALVDLSSAIEARFDGLINEPALRGNVELLVSGERVAISTPSYDSESGVVSFTPEDQLKPGTAYKVRIASAVGGELLKQPDAFTWNFSTRIPSVIATSPVDEGNTESGPERLEVVFSGPVDPNLVDSRSFTLSRLGEPIVLADDEFSYDPETFTVRFPVVELRSGSAYEASVNARVSGPLARQIRLPDRHWSFTTEIPQVLESRPADGSDGVSISDATLQISFTESTARQDKADFQMSARSLDDPEAPVELVSITGFGANASGTVINFAPEGGLKPFTEYQVSMDRSVLGDLALSGFSWTFRTAASLADARLGGTIRDGSGQVELYLPPNALPPGTNEVTISRIVTGAGKRVQDVELTQISDAYSIRALGTLSKRATLTMYYSDDQLGASDPAKLGIFHRVGDQWFRLGGTRDKETRGLLTTIEDWGTFAIFEDRSVLVGSLAVRDLDCQPRAFAPRGGGIRDQTDISFTLTGPADVTVRIYNASGRLERVMVREEPMAPGRVTLKWDGQDEDQKIVGSGLYIIAVDAGGQRSEKVVAVVQ